MKKTSAKKKVVSIDPAEKAGGVAPKPRLVRIGAHFLDPANITGIKQAKRGLYIIMLRSEPEPQYPLWLTETELDIAKEYFDIIGDRVYDSLDEDPF